MGCTGVMEASFDKVWSRAGVARCVIAETATRSCMRREPETIDTELAYAARCKCLATGDGSGKHGDNTALSARMTGGGLR